MRLTPEQLRHELETDPAGLGYRAGGAYLSAAEIGHLLVSPTADGTCRLEQLCGGGHLCLKSIARVVYGRDWVCEMLRRGEIEFAEIQALAAPGKITLGKITPGVLAAATAIREAHEHARATTAAAHVRDVEFEADPYDPRVDGPVPPDPFETGGHS